MGSELPLKWLQLSSRVRTSVLPTERESKTCIFHGCSQKFTMGPTAGPPRPSQRGPQPVLPDPHGGAHSRSSWFTGMVGALQWIHLPFWCRLSETQTWVLTCRRSFPSSPSHVTKATLLSRADGSIPVSAPGVPPPATLGPWLGCSNVVETSSGLCSRVLTKTSTSSQAILPAPRLFHCEVSCFIRNRPA